MDYDRIQREVEGRVKALFYKHFPNGLIPIDTKGLTKKERRALLNAPNPVMAAYRAEAARLDEFKVRVRDHRNWLAARARRNGFIERIMAEVETVRQAIADGKTLMAFDVERTVADDRTKEIGVTLYRNGVFESYNYRAQGMNLKIGFSYGDTCVMPVETIYDKMREHGHEADYYVGHSLISDFEHLRRQCVKLPKRQYFDTLWWSMALAGFEDGNSLSALVDHFGLSDSFRPHNGGNDARMTMEVLIRMAMN